MSSQPPTLPPSVIAGASAQAKIDRIAVRLINFPSNARLENQPSKLTGLVAGSNIDGSLNIDTEMGRIVILLKDKGSLPQGYRLTVDIPAGRNPAQATIQSAPVLQNREPATPLPAPSMVEATQVEVKNSPAPATIIANKIQPETIQNILTQTQTSTVNIKSPLSVMVETPIQAGQIIRLLPLTPNSLAQNILQNLQPLKSGFEILNQLVNSIISLPNNSLATRDAAIKILSQMNIPALMANNVNASTEQIKNLQNKIFSLIQSIPDADTLDSALPPQQGSSSLFKNSSPLTLFNPSKPIDSQVLGMMSENNVFLSLVADGKTTNSIFRNGLVSPAQTVGFTDAGNPILSVALPQSGMSSMYTISIKPNNLALGSLIFMALDSSIQKSMDISISTFNTTSPVLSSGFKTWLQSGLWESFDDLLQNITMLSPAQSGIGTMFPNPSQPQTMNALSLFFLSLFRNGQSAEGWIPEQALTILRQMGKADLLRHASADMTIMNKLDQMTLPQDWRMTVLPLLWDNHVYKAPLYFKHMKDENSEDEENDKKRRRLRFLFDLNLSRMGGVQIDGFLQSERLDIILRTKSPLSSPMQTQMKRLYAGAMEHSKLTGELAFQFKPEQWVDLSFTSESAEIQV
jgi:hypothetical protein